MTRIRIIGITIFALGIGMFVFGAGMFTYQGEPLNPIISKLGEYSFFCWMPILGLGAVLVICGGKPKEI